mgnify:CR=1
MKPHLDFSGRGGRGLVESKVISKLLEPAAALLARVKVGVSPARDGDETAVLNTKVGPGHKILKGQESAHRGCV